jgi:hypothetical protein
MPMHYEDEEEDDFPMMAKRKMMRMMKAKKMEDDYPKMEKETEMSLVKIEINVGESNGKGKK